MLSIKKIYVEKTQKVDSFLKMWKLMGFEVFGIQDSSMPGGDCLLVEHPLLWDSDVYFNESSFQITVYRHIDLITERFEDLGLEVEKINHTYFEKRLYCRGDVLPILISIIEILDSITNNE